ncbi:MAG: hypothetical protein AB7K36_11270 [Chloroflexota bacterium]
MEQTHSPWARTDGFGRALVALLAMVLAFAGGAASQPVHAAGTPLRQVDWLAVLEHDPSVTIDPTAFQPPGEAGPYVTVVMPGSAGDVLEGYALTNGVQYADLDGNGSEEAVIPVSSGGTAGLLGFMLYREGTPAPQLVLVEVGYKLSFTIEGGHLVVYSPNYVGFEPNCCPSSGTREVTVLEGNRLVTISSEVEPYDVQEPTVWAFYSALQDKRYEDAYAFYSPAFQASNPFNQWKAGYASTQSIEVQTSPGATPTEVLIELTATDRQPNGINVTRRFRGAWTLIWSADQKRWLLDHARIEPA